MSYTLLNKVQQIKRGNKQIVNSSFLGLAFENKIFFSAKLAISPETQYSVWQNQW